MSDVPLKICEFMVVIFDSKATHNLYGQRWMEVTDENQSFDMSLSSAIDTEFMIHPKKLYQIVFIAEQYQFVENSELKANRLEIKMGTGDSAIILVQNFSSSPKANFKSYNRSLDGLNNISSGLTCYITPM